MKRNNIFRDEEQEPVNILFLQKQSITATMDIDYL